jgi:hypothetical protein
MRPDSSAFLEITYIEEGRIKRIREEKTAKQLLELRERLKQSTFVEVTSAPLSGLDQSARTKLITATTLMSTFIYGPLIISSIEDVRTEVAAGMELIIGGAGFLVPLLLTENSSVTEGEASLATGGMLLGIGHGIMLDVLLTNADLGSELGILASVVSIGETIAGYRIAHVNNFQAGKSDIISLYGLCGFGQGILLPIVFSDDLYDISGTLFGGLALGVSGLGYVAGNAVSNATRYTRGDATVTTTTAFYTPLCVLGLVLPSLARTNAEDAARVISLGAMAGNIGGLWLGHYLAERKDLSEDEGRYIALGTLAGGLIGTGIGLLFASGTDELVDLYQFTIPAVLGTAAGFVISYNVFGKGTGKNEGSNWNVRIDPGALLGGLSEPLPPRLNAPPSPTPPTLSLSYHW